MKMCAQGKARLYPSHGPLRFITSRSPLPCEKRSTWGGGWVYRLRSRDPHYQKGRKGRMDWAPRKLHPIHWFASILPQYERIELLRERGPKRTKECKRVKYLKRQGLFQITHLLEHMILLSSIALFQVNVVFFLTLIWSETLNSQLHVI